MKEVLRRTFFFIKSYPCFFVTCQNCLLNQYDQIKQRCNTYMIRIQHFSLSKIQVIYDQLLWHATNGAHSTARRASNGSFFIIPQYLTQMRINNLTLVLRVCEMVFHQIIQCVYCENERTFVYSLFFQAISTLIDYQIFLSGFQ